MNKVLLNFKIVKINCYLEVVFDSRLSFLENFKELIGLYEYEIDLDSLSIYDPYKKVMLDLDKPLDNFYFGSYRFLMIY